MSKHPLQSKEWGEFREKTGIKVVRTGGIQITIHPIPHTPWTIGYLPKGPMPDSSQVKVLEKIAREHKSIYIKCEPKVENGQWQMANGKWMEKMGFWKGRRLFTPHNFVLDVTKSEEELLRNMKQKTRYNIRLAKKKGVEVAIDNSDEAFEKYLELTAETTKRQGFYAHTPKYHATMWQTLGKHQTLNPKLQINPKSKIQNNKLTADLIVARYAGKIITAWVLFTYKDTLYYPYGASSREHREVMANNLVMWEAIKFAKKRGLKYLDMWGALGPDPDPNDPWYGFHKFKEGYGGRHITYIGTWDYVARPLLYYPLRVVEWARWKWLRLM